MAAAFEAEIGFQEPIIQLARAVAGEVAELLLAALNGEGWNADLSERRAHRPALNRQPCRLRQSPQLHAERAEDAQRFFALVEQTGEDGQRLASTAAADGIENLPRVLF